MNEKAKLYKCWDCLGSGNKKWYSHVDGGVCYTCGGTGKAKLPYSDKTSYTYAEKQAYKIALADTYDDLNEVIKLQGALAAEIAKQLDPQKDVKHLQPLVDKLQQIISRKEEIIEEGKKLQQQVTDVKYTPFL